MIKHIHIMPNLWFITQVLKNDETSRNQLTESAFRFDLYNTKCSEN